MSAKTSYCQAARDVELLTGMSISAKTQERLVNRTPIDVPKVEATVEEIALEAAWCLW
jgi:hypothetical protein